MSGVRTGPVGAPAHLAGTTANMVSAELWAVMSRHRTEGQERVDPTDTAAIHEALADFAGAATVDSLDDGGVRVAFSGRTHVTVHADGTVETGMPLHSFSGPADVLVVDYGAGELRVEVGTDGEREVAYVFRRP